MGFFSGLEFSDIDVQNMKQQAQQKAIELGVFGAVSVIASTGTAVQPKRFQRVDQQRQGEMIKVVDWEGCEVTFTTTTAHAVPGASILGERFLSAVARIADTEAKALVIAPDGRVLYEAEEGGNLVKAFRFGPWVERIKAEADAILKKQQAAIAAEQNAKLEKDLEPFSDIDF